VALGDLVGNFGLHNVFFSNANVRLQRGDGDVVVEMSDTIILTEFDGSKLDVYFFTVHLIGFHRTHGTEARITATLRTDREGREGRQN
jgi:hypothetical protein